MNLVLYKWQRASFITWRMLSTLFIYNKVVTPILQLNPFLRCTYLLIKELFLTILHTIVQSLNKKNRTKITLNKFLETVDCYHSTRAPKWCSTSGCRTVLNSNPTSIGINKQILQLHSVPTRQMLPTTPAKYSENAKWIFQLVVRCYCQVRIIQKKYVHTFESLFHT